MNFFNRARQTAFVDDEPQEVIEGEIVEDVLERNGYDPTNRSLVQVRPDNKPVILKPNDRINFRDGNEFMSQLNPTGG